MQRTVSGTWEGLSSYHSLLLSVLFLLPHWAACNSLRVSSTLGSLAPSSGPDIGWRLGMLAEQSEFYLEPQSQSSKQIYLHGFSPDFNPFQNQHLG